MDRAGLTLRLASTWRVWALALAATGVASLALVRDVRRSSIGATQRIEAVAPCSELVAPVDIGPVVPVELERRWLALGGFESAAAIDEALGGAVRAWEPFFYLGDAQPRLAVVTEVFASNEPQPVHELVRDRNGGIWHIRREPLPPPAASARRTPVTYNRDIYVLPTGAAFRGELDAGLHPVVR